MLIRGNANNNKVFMQIANLNNLQSKAIRRAFYDIGKILVKDAQEAIDEKPKTGITYMVRVGRDGKALQGARKHIASAPGEAPASITGNLRKSVNFLVQGDSRMEFGVDAGRKNVKYGKYLEYGNLVAMNGRGSKNIAPRPFISRSYKKNQQHMIAMFESSLKRSLGSL